MSYQISEHKNEIIITFPETKFLCHSSKYCKDVIEFITEIVNEKHITEDFLLHHNIDDVYFQNKCSKIQHKVVLLIKELFPEIPTIKQYYIKLKKNSRIDVLGFSTMGNTIYFGTSKMGIVRRKNKYGVYFECDYIDFDPDVKHDDD